jgi:hypothetical protein
MAILSTQPLHKAKEHFSKMLSSREPMALPIARPCGLRVNAGLHRGALMKLEKPAFLGSALENDIVLLDPEIMEKHAQLLRVDNVWTLIKVIDNSIMVPFEIVRNGRFTRRRYAIGTAQITISQADQNQPKKTVHNNKYSHKFLASILLVAAAALGSIVIVQVVRPAAANVIKGTRNLTSEGWPDVDLVGSEHIRILARGFVKDASSMKRLLDWLKVNDFDSVTMTVRIGSDLAARVKEALAENTLPVVYVGAGTVRVTGTSENMATRERLSRIKADLANVVNIDDQVAFSQAEIKPRQHVLPIRIQDVRVGTDESNSSFSSDNGTRYFIGAVLPDGSEVLAIKKDGIAFTLDNRIITYPLK